MIEKIISDLENQNYWDVHYRKEGKFGAGRIDHRFGYLTTRQEYDIETCHKIRDEIIEILKKRSTNAK